MLITTEINLFFFGLLLLSSEINCFFGHRQQSNARAGQEKISFFGNALPESNARAHLKQINKIYWHNADLKLAHHL